MNEHDDSTVPRLCFEVLEASFLCPFRLASQELKAGDLLLAKQTLYKAPVHAADFESGWMVVLLGWFEDWKARLTSLPLWSSVLAMCSVHLPAGLAPCSSSGSKVADFFLEVAPEASDTSYFVRTIHHFHRRRPCIVSHRALSTTVHCRLFFPVDHFTPSITLHRLKPRISNGRHIVLPPRAPARTTLEHPRMRLWSPNHTHLLHPRRHALRPSGTQKQTYCHLAHQQGDLQRGGFDTVCLHHICSQAPHLRPVSRQALSKGRNTSSTACQDVFLAMSRLRKLARERDIACLGQGLHVSLIIISWSFDPSRASDQRHHENACWRPTASHSRFAYRLPRDLKMARISGKGRTTSCDNHRSGYE
ncbi:hypothetical protein EJ03DRAFT_132881 [Teratosphaeria nubilosa]|uniref:Uncharacterized protein n=1 Tax=Teratosphaeria nubilosa TaxID=161662 RepID=A0A6G1L661_9PEZI|nr:hypothetical protein EJ03DRAFT_132881 [Teratosphaeria nubilosa]